MHCWGCSKLILVPYNEHNRPAEMFKCGWCGAVNNLNQQPVLAYSTPQHIPLSPQSAWQGQQGEQALQHDQQGFQHASREQQPPAYDYYCEQQHKWQQQQQQWQPSVLLPLNGMCTPSNRSSQRSRCSWRKLWAAVLRLWRWMVVALVVLLISSIAGCGIVTLLPLICTTWPTYLPNASLAVLLLFQIGFNYAASVLQPAGRVSDHVSPPARTAEGFVAQDSLLHWTWCRHCQAAKPPQAHHCRACGACVVNMDHHCPFINNCVGQGNLRAFLLFLMWALLAAAYIIAMCSLLVWQNWDVVKAAFAAGRNSMLNPQQISMHQPQVVVIQPVRAAAAAAGMSADGGAAADSRWSINSSSSDPPAVSPYTGRHTAELWLVATTGIFFVVLQASPWWLLAAYYLIAVSCGVLIAVGMLLGSQLYYLGMGVSYIDHLKGMTAAEVQQHEAVQAQPLQPAHKPGCCRRIRSCLQLTWSRWWEVVGASPSDNAVTMLRALLRPCWHLPTAQEKKST